MLTIYLRQAFVNIFNSVNSPGGMGMSSNGFGDCEQKRFTKNFSTDPKTFRPDSVPGKNVRDPWKNSMVSSAGGD
jgi:hypothetical protein